MKYINLNTLPKGYYCLFNENFHDYWAINDKTGQDIFICSEVFNYLKNKFPTLLVPLDFYNQIQFPHWIEAIALCNPETKLSKIIKLTKGKKYDTFEEDKEMCNTLRKILTIEMVEEKLKDFIIDIPNSI